MTNTVSKTISDETLNRIITIESAGRPTAKAPTSSATGLFQFINATWLSFIRKYRPDLCAGKSDAQILALRTDPAVSIEIGARFTEENAAGLGSGYTDGDLYLAHFLGLGAARALLRAAPSTSTASLVSGAAISANASILRGKTAAQVRSWAASRMAASGGHNWIAQFYKAHPAPKPVEPAKEAAKNAAGGAAAGGATGAATGVKQGWGPEQWITFIVVLAIVAVAIFAVSYWWKHRKKAAAEVPQLAHPATAYEPDSRASAEGLAAVAAAVAPAPVKKPSARRSVAKKAKPKAKAKAKAKPKKRRA